MIIVAHLGRPKGKVNPDYSLAPVAERLAEVTGVEVTLAPDTVGEGAGYTRRASRSCSSAGRAPE